jgi:hypothetical protein
MSDTADGELPLGIETAAEARAAAELGKVGLTPEKAAELVWQFLDVVDQIDATLLANKRELQAKNQPHRDRLSAGFKKLVKDGVIPSTELATFIAERRLNRKLERIDHALNDEQKATFAALRRAAAGLEGTPMGDHALRVAEAEDQDGPAH